MKSGARKFGGAIAVGLFLCACGGSGGDGGDPCASGTETGVECEDCPAVSGPASADPAISGEWSEIRDWSNDGKHLTDHPAHLAA